MNNQDYNFRNINDGYNNGFKSFDEKNSEFNRTQKKNPNNGYYQGYQNNNMYNTYVKKENITSSPSKEKLRYGKVFLPIVILFLIVSVLFVCYKVYKNYNQKLRTFMIYMVGSDLESQSKQGTYSISDIVGENIDLKNNNVILMVGGSKKWHNFVNSEEIGIYKLTNEGFKKVKSLPVDSMGNSEMLTDFLNYSYKNYPAKNYDMIFWNHGLGAMGIEQDEVSSDYLSIQELDIAFNNSNFSNKKLELTIFYNCLASNIHIAKIMSNYSNYMVASEELFYLSRVLNRLNFLEKVTKDDSAFDIGIHFIEQSDKVVNNYNIAHSDKIDSTLSIINLNKIDILYNKINEFVGTINIEKNYMNIASLRRNLHTYGRSQANDYDTVDLYELVEALAPYSNNQEIANDVLGELSNVVEYTSNLNDHSNGLSIYFPYFGKDRAIEVHLDIFGHLWNDNYLHFIESFYQIRSGIKRNTRSNRETSVNKLENKLKYENNTFKIYLTEEEITKYEYANLYLFKKVDNDEYTLILKSNKINIKDNILSYEKPKSLKIYNSFISYFEEADDYLYGTISDNEDSLDVIEYFLKNENSIKYNYYLLDSGDYPTSGLIDIGDYSQKSFYSLKYNLIEDGEINEDWKESITKEVIEINEDNLELKDINEEYYALIEVLDTHNDSYYSNLERVN